MRVAFISDVGEKYGAAQCLLELLDTLSVEYGVEPVLLTSGEGRLKAYADEHGYEHHAIGHSAFYITEGTNGWRRLVKKVLYPVYYFRYICANYRAMARAESCVDFGRIDLIHSNVNRNDIGALLARKHGIPHVWHIREFGDTDYRCKSLRKDYISFMNQNADIFLAVSRAVAEHWIKKGINPAKVKVVYDGVSEKYKTSYGRGVRKGCRVIMSGSIGPGKCQDQLIEAVGVLPDDIKKQISVDIYGSGTPEFIGSLKHRVKKLKLSGIVRFMGYREDMQKRLPLYDIGVICSRTEGFGRVTAEYMISGMCVVASDTGANPELVKDGETGFLYAWGNYRQLAEKIAILCKNDTLRESIGKSAAKYAGKHFTCFRNAAEIYAIYRKLCIVNKGDGWLRKGC